MWWGRLSSKMFYTYVSRHLTIRSRRQWKWHYFNDDSSYVRTYLCILRYLALIRYCFYLTELWYGEQKVNGIESAAFFEPHVEEIFAWSIDTCFWFLYNPSQIASAKVLFKFRNIFHSNFFAKNTSKKCWNKIIYYLYIYLGIFNFRGYIRIIIFSMLVCTNIIKQICLFKMIRL